MATYTERPIDRAGHALTALTAVRDLVGDIDQMTTHGNDLSMLLLLIENHLKDALDDLLAAQLEQQTQDFKESVAAVRRGYQDLKAGRYKPAEQFFAEVREKHGFPR